MPRRTKTPSGTLALRLYRRRWRDVRNHEQLLVLLQKLAVRLLPGRSPRIRTQFTPDHQRVIVYVQTWRHDATSISSTTSTLGTTDHPQGGFTPLQGEMVVRALFRLGATEELNR